jgi:hypothetical protein
MLSVSTVRPSDELTHISSQLLNSLSPTVMLSRPEQVGQGSRLRVNGLGAAGGNRQGQGEKSFFMREAP